MTELETICFEGEKAPSPTSLKNCFLPQTITKRLWTFFIYFYYMAGWHMREICFIVHFSFLFDKTIPLVPSSSLIFFFSFSFVPHFCYFKPSTWKVLIHHC